MGRHQTGYSFESASSAFHLRYYITEIVDGQPKRVQKSHLLCRKDNKHFSQTCKAVKLLRDDFMRTINKTSADTAQADMLVTDSESRSIFPSSRRTRNPARSQATSKSGISISRLTSRV